MPLIGLFNRHVAGELLFSVLIAFLFFFVVFFINVLLVTADDILSRQVPFADAVRLIAYALPQILALAFPFATLLGAQISLGRLSADRELLAAQACGMPLPRVFAPLVAIGVLLSGLSFATNDLLLPAGTIEFNRLYRRILFQHPAVELAPNSVHRFEDVAIVTGDLIGDELQDVTIIDRIRGGEKRVIAARTLRLAASERQPGVLSLRLGGVFTHSVEAASDDFEYAQADGMEYNIALPDIDDSSIGPNEQSSVDVWREIAARRAEREQRQRQLAAGLAHALLFDLVAAVERLAGTPAGQRPRALVEERLLLDRQYRALAEEVENAPYEPVRNHLFEFHKKFAVPAACLVFMLFALAAGVVAPHSGRTYGLVVGMAMAVVYWGLLVSAHGVGERTLHPALAIWMPNLAVLAIAGTLYAVRR